jgi:hypothetical protein
MTIELTEYQCNLVKNLLANAIDVENKAAGREYKKGNKEGYDLQCRYVNEYVETLQQFLIE